MKVKSLDQLFETGLRYAYDSEQKLVKKGILSMIEAASSQELRSALEGHLQETIGHVTRLERIFGMIGAEPKAEDNSIMDEITKTAEKMVDVTEEGSALREDTSSTTRRLPTNHSRRLRANSDAPMPPACSTKS
jgi:ferritin-like metal-binding protein YciE